MSKDEFRNSTGSAVNRIGGIGNGERNTVNTC